MLLTNLLSSLNYLSKLCLLNKDLLRYITYLVLYFALSFCLMTRIVRNHIDLLQGILTDQSILIRKEIYCKFTDDRINYDFVLIIYFHQDMNHRR